MARDRVRSAEKLLTQGGYAFTTEAERSDWAEARQRIRTGGPNPTSAILSAAALAERVLAAYQADRAYSARSIRVRVRMS